MKEMDFFTLVTDSFDFYIRTNLFLGLLRLVIAALPELIYDFFKEIY